MPHTIIVVPCFNEEKRLPVDQFRDFLARNTWVEFAMVNDGSSDGTLTVVERLQGEYPQSIHIVNLTQNQGKAEAVRQGILTALIKRPEFIGYWDADLAAPLALLRSFRDVVDRNPEIEIVLGTRIALLGHAVHRDPVRHLLGRVFAALASTLLRVPIYDTQAGHKLFRVTERLRSAVATRFSTRWIFDVELLARWLSTSVESYCEPARELIYELPLEEWRDITGSKLRTKDFVLAGLDLLRLAAISITRSITRKDYRQFTPGSACYLRRAERGGAADADTQ